MEPSVENNPNKSLKFSSLNACGLLYIAAILKSKTSKITHTDKTTYGNTLNTSNAARNLSFNKNNLSAVRLKNISRKFKRFWLKISRFFLHIFLILIIADGFNLSSVLAISETKSGPEILNLSSVTSSSLLTALASSQLPVEALILEANTNNGAYNGFGKNQTKHTIYHNLHGKSNSSSSSSNSNSNGNSNGYRNNSGDIALFNSEPSILWATFTNSNSNAINGITSAISSPSISPWPLWPSPSPSYFQNDNISSMANLSTTMEPGSPPPSITSSPASSEFSMPAVHTVLVSIILLFFILGTIVGNVLVCIAVCMVRKLRRPCNYLLVSLALSDLCVAVLVMPMALLYEVLEKWNFGPVLCDIWVSFDVLCCTASILNLCAISVDRYLAITKPLEYGVKRTPRRMMLCVGLVWLAAACISLPPLLILGNEHVDEHGNPMCSVCQNFAYQIYATLGSFYIPLAVMLFVYYQIFRAARRIVLEEKRAQTHLQHALNGTGSPPAHTDFGGNGERERHSSYGNTSLNYSTCGGLSVSQAGGGGGGGSGSSGLLGSPHQKKLRFQLAKEKKASTTLGIIMSAFTICWLPFFILALIRPFVENETTHVPQSLSSFFLWLGYANSLLNPIIYATLNRDFRKPFQEILYFRCSSLNTMMRENYYQDQYGEPPSQRVMLGDERHGARESFL